MQFSTNRSASPVTSIQTTGLGAVLLAFALVLSGCAETTDGDSSSAPVEAPATAETKPSTDSAETESQISELEIVDDAALASLLKGEKGEVLVVNFWATWCPPCVEEMPELVKFYNEFKDRGVNFYAVSADHPKTIEDRVKPFVEEHELPFPVKVMNIPDPTVVAEMIDTDWTGGLPATFVFNTEGELAKEWLGAIDRDTLAQAVEPLLTSTDDSESTG